MPYKPNPEARGVSRKADREGAPATHLPHRLPVRPRLRHQQQIGLLVITGIAAMAGASAWSLLSLPFLFAAAMTLGDTANGLMMLKMYESAHDDPKRKINFNLVITGIGIISALTVGTLATATLLTEQAGLRIAVLESIATTSTQHAGYMLAGLFAIIGAIAYALWRRSPPIR